MERFDCEMVHFPPKVRLAVTKIHAKCKVLRARNNILLLLIINYVNKSSAKCYSKMLFKMLLHLAEYFFNTNLC